MEAKSLQDHGRCVVMSTQGCCVCLIDVKPPVSHVRLALNRCVRLAPQGFLLEDGAEFPFWSSVVEGPAAAACCRLIIICCRAACKSLVSLAVGVALECAGGFAAVSVEVEVVA